MFFVLFCFVLFFIFNLLNFNATRKRHNNDDAKSQESGEWEHTKSDIILTVDECGDSMYQKLCEYVRINKRYLNSVTLKANKMEILDKIKSHYRTKNLFKLVETMTEMDNYMKQCGFYKENFVHLSRKLSLFYDMKDEQSEWGIGKQPLDSLRDKMIKYFTKWCKTGSISISVQFEIGYNKNMHYWKNSFIPNHLSDESGWIQLIQAQVNADTIDSKCKMSTQFGTKNDKIESCKIAFVKFTIENDAVTNKLLAIE